MLTFLALTRVKTNKDLDMIENMTHEVQHVEWHGCLVHRNTHHGHLALSPSEHNQNFQSQLLGKQLCKVQIHLT